MNSDDIKRILNEQGIDGLIKAIHQYTGSKYWSAYRDGKYNGYAKAINEIVKAK